MDSSWIRSVSGPRSGLASSLLVTLAWKISIHVAVIADACFLTSSTGFVNPAVTLARPLSDKFAGIAPSSIVPFVLAQAAGAVLACATVRFLWPKIADSAEVVLLPHQQEAEVD